MAKPIRDRGIRWSENYGEKSAHLKNEMTEQIGIGSYFRWEGHDYTTNTDYYVVVSPGFSKKKGYFFFAGLRKMPADHGASGKKFATQAEAMSHAFETWAVPRPLERPAKKYNRDDLINKPIVMEAQHKGASSDVPGRIIVANEVYLDEDDADMHMSKEAMAIGQLMNEVGLGSNWKRLGTQKHFKDVLCGAARASGTMGFLAAMQSRMSLIGIDGANYSGEGFKDQEGNVVRHPYSPVMATAQGVAPEELKSFTKEAWTKKYLIEPRKNPRGDETDYSKIDPWQKKGFPGYEQVTWSDYMLSLKVPVPFARYASSEALWSRLEALGANLGEKTYDNRGEEKHPPVSVEFDHADRPSAYVRKVEQKGEERKENEEVTVHVAPELYPDVVRIIQEMRLSPMPKQNSLKMANYLEYLHQQDQGFKPDEILYEKVMVTGSQTLVYDDQGMPFALAKPDDLGTYLIPRSLNAPEEDVSSDTHNMIGQLTNSLNGSKQLIADSIYPGILKVNDFMASNASDKEGRARMHMEAGMAKPRDESRADFLAKCDAYIKARTSAAAMSTALQRSGKSNNPMLQKAKDRMQTALDEVSPYLTAFRHLASMGLANLDAGRFVHSETCAPTLTPIFTKGYDLNEAGLPNDMESLSGTTPQSIVPPTQVSARVEGQGEDKKNYARQRVIQPDGSYAENYVEVPETALAVQEVSGAPVVVKDSGMSMARGGFDYSAKAAAKGIRRWDPNSEGRYIPGKVFSVFMRPLRDSPAKTGRGRETSGGWAVDSGSYDGIESGGIVIGGKQKKPASMLSNKRGDGSMYEIASEDATSASDMSGHVGKDGKTNIFTNSGMAIEWLQNKLGLPADLVGAITSMDATDLSLAEDKANTAMHLFELSRKEPQNPEVLNAQEGMSPEEWKHLMAFGEMCTVCGRTKGQLKKVPGLEGQGGDAIGEGLLQMLGDAMKNPSESLYPKRGTMWGIEFRDPSTGNYDFYKVQGQKLPVLFSSNASPRLKDTIAHLAFTHAEDSGIAQEEAMRLLDAKAKIFNEDGLLTPSVTMSGKTLVEGKENYLSENFPDTYDPSTLLPSDEVAARPAFDMPGDVAKDEVEDKPPVEEDADPQMPDADQVPDLSQLPEVAPAVDVAPAGAQTGAPEFSEQQQESLSGAEDMLRGAAERAGIVPGQAVTPEQAKKVDPASQLWRNKFRRDPALSAQLEKIISRIIGVPEPAQEPVARIQPVSPQQASVIDKLVRLADKLDNTGKPNEADQVDRLIRETSRA